MGKFKVTLGGPASQYEIVFKVLNTFIANQWFKEDWGDIFRSTNMDWNPFKLGLFEIPIATLDDPIFSKERILALQLDISKHQFVYNVEIVEP